MSATLTNGTRKTLADQIDRLDAMLDGLAEAVSRLIADHGLAATLAERGRRKVVDERVWFDRVWAVYEELTSRPRMTPVRGEEDV